VARRKAKEPTADYLRRVAFWYLERYGGTALRVRNALERRVRRSVAELESDPRAGAAAIDAVLTELSAMGLVDDDRFAESRARTLRGRGKSRRAIVATLRRQGVSMAAIEQALDKAGDEGDDELAAARRFVKKRRSALQGSRERKLQRLARAGFSFEVAARALDEEAAQQDDFGP
jgi:regulatory protein